MTAQSSPLTIDEARRELRVGPRTIDLEPRVFDLVAYLAARTERVVPKDELLDAVWPDLEVGDGSLQRAVSIARAALRDAGLEDPIRTFARRGYRFCLIEPEGSYAAFDAGDRQTASEAAPPPDEGETGRTERAGSGHGPHMPVVQYAQTSDGCSVAYSVTGQGPPLIRVLGWFTHIDMEWRWAKGRRFWDRLAQKHTLVRYDGRGMGLSQPAEQFSMETRLRDLEAVIEATGFERFALLGMSEGVYAATHYAARNPERVTHLITYGNGVSGNEVEAAAWVELGKLFVQVIRQGWGSETPAYRQLFANLLLGPRAPLEDVEYFCEMQRVSAPMSRAVRYMESLLELASLVGDGVEESARAVRVPTMVVHRPKETIIPFSRSQRLAAVIPGARLCTLDGDNHWLLLDDTGAPDFVRAIEEFIESR